MHTVMLQIKETLNPLIEFNIRNHFIFPFICKGESYLHYGNVDQLLEGMSGNLFQGQLGEPSVRFMSKAVKSTDIVQYKYKIKRKIGSKMSL